MHFTLANSFLGVLLGPLLRSNITKLQAGGSLYYGGNRDFFSDTVLSLTKALFYGSIDAVPVLAAAAVVLLAGILVLLFTQPRNWWRKPITPLKIYLLLTAAIVVGINLHFYFLGSLLVLDRAGLFFFPLLGLILMGFLFESGHSLWRTRLVGGFALVAAINLLVHVNLSKTYLWFFDGPTPKILAELNQKGAEAGRKLQISFAWPLQNSMTFYLESGKYPYLNSAFDYNQRDSIPQDIDYFIQFTGSLAPIEYKIPQLPKDYLPATPGKILADGYVQVFASQQGQGQKNSFKAEL